MSEAAGPRGTQGGASCCPTRVPHRTSLSAAAQAGLASCRARGCRGLPTAPWGDGASRSSGKCRTCVERRIHLREHLRSEQRVQLATGQRHEHATRPERECGCISRLDAIWWARVGGWSAPACVLPHHTRSHRDCGHA